MFIAIRAIFRGILIVAFGAATALGDEVIRLPFGLSWGEAAEDLEGRLGEAGARIEERKAVDGGEIWTVEGVKQEGLQRVVFTLHSGSLSAVELQYGAEVWDVWTFDEFVHRVRGSLEARYGAGRQLSRKREQAETVMQTLVAYTWPIHGKAVELVYFAAQDEQHAFRLVSLHYKPAPAERSVAAGPTLSVTNRRSVQQ